MSEPQRGVVIILVSKQKVLLILRDPAEEGERATFTNPFRWSLPSGGVEEGECPAEAARRELAEELGLAVKLTELGTTSNGNTLFIGRMASSRVPSLGEGCAFGFFSLKALERYMAIGNEGEGELGGIIARRIKKHFKAFSDLVNYLTPLPPEFFL